MKRLHAFGICPRMSGLALHAKYPCTVVLSNEIQVTLSEGKRLLSPDGVGNIELQRRLIFGLCLSSLSQLQIEGVEGGMELSLGKEVHRFRHLRFRLATRTRVGHGKGKRNAVR